jgi:hypothetical protein
MSKVFFSKHMHKLGIMAGCAIVLMLGFTNTHIISNDDGISGYVRPSSGGCDCHGSSASANTQVNITSRSGSFTITPGGTLELTAVVANSGKSAVGVNIGVKDAVTSNRNVGTLARINNDMRLSANELVHTSPKSMSGGQASFSFTWKAPTTAGTYYLMAIGNAVNGNGRDSGDEWAYLTPIEITVSAASSVLESQPMISSLTAAPNPAVDNSTVSYALEKASDVEIMIIDAKGGLVYSQSLGMQNPGAYSFNWNALTNQGIAAPAGHYMLNLKAGSAVHSTSLILQH